MSTRVILWTAFGLAVLAGGCVNQRAQAPEIKDEWVARVPPDQLEPVYQARQDRRRAQDEVTRARVAVTDAENELTVKRSIQEATNKRVEAAQKALEAAEQTGDQNQIQQAQTALLDSEQKRTVAEADLNYAQEQLDLAMAERAYVEAQVDTQEEMVNQARYQVLREIGDTRVKNIDPVEFEQAITAALNREREAQMKVSEERSQVASAEQQLNDARQQMGIGGAGQ